MSAGRSEVAMLEQSRLVRQTKFQGTIVTNWLSPPCRAVIHIAHSAFSTRFAIYYESTSLRSVVH